MPMQRHGVFYRIAAAACEGPENEAHLFMRRNADTCTHRSDRVEHATLAAVELGTLIEGSRIAQAAATTDKGTAVSFDFRFADRAGKIGHEMRDVDIRIGRRALAALGIDGRTVIGDFGLYEHLGKGRMGGIAVAVGQHQFRIGGDLDHTVAGGRVDDVEPAAFAVRFRRHDHFHDGLDVTGGLVEFRLVFGEDRLGFLFRVADRFAGCRPPVSAFHVAQEQERALKVFRRIGVEAGNVPIVPAAVA